MNTTISFDQRIANLETNYQIFRKTLTSAQLLSMRANPVRVVLFVDPGKMIVPLVTMLRYNFVTKPYVIPLSADFSILNAEAYDSGFNSGDIAIFSNTPGTVLFSCNCVGLFDQTVSTVFQQTGMNGGWPSFPIPPSSNDREYVIGIPGAFNWPPPATDVTTRVPAELTGGDGTLDIAMVYTPL